MRSWRSTFGRTVVLAWRRVAAADNGDVNGLFVATVCGLVELVLLTLWLQDREGG